MTLKPNEVRPRGSQAGMAGLKREPHCERCGTSVAEGTRFCEVCGPLMEARKAPVGTVIIREIIREVPATPTATSTEKE
jgi:hypothetical protein